MFSTGAKAPICSRCFGALPGGLEWEDPLQVHNWLIQWGVVKGEEEEVPAVMPGMQVGWRLDTPDREWGLNMTIVLDDVTERRVEGKLAALRQRLEEAWIAFTDEVRGRADSMGVGGG